MSSLKNIRTDYTKGSMSVEEMSSCPVVQLNTWIDEAEKQGVNDYNAFCLSTVNASGYPTGRIVLARQIDVDGVVFYTNKNSSKGSEIKALANVGVTFFWAEMQRQVRLSGNVSHLSEDENDKYFASRPRESQISAWASSQSEDISSREDLEKKHSHFEDKFKELDDIPRPPYWGGYRVSIEEIEFWQGRASRLHDRVKYLKTSEEEWVKSLLQP